VRHGFNVTDRTANSSWLVCALMTSRFSYALGQAFSRYGATQMEYPIGTPAAGSHVKFIGHSELLIHTMTLEAPSHESLQPISEILPFICVPQQVCAALQSAVDRHEISIAVNKQLPGALHTLPAGNALS
jgi:hypothetical protein